MAAAPLFLKDIHLTFGGDPLLAGADLTIGQRARIALVGRNGSGKSTLLKIAAGLIEADKGERHLDPGITVAYLEQDPDLTAHKTVLNYVCAGLASTESTHEAERWLDELGLSHDMPTHSMSGGEARRAAIARVLCGDPEILLLDEPTNHLDISVIEWLEATLKGLSSSMVIISHDRRFLENLTNQTVWVDRGACRSLNRSFAHFEEWRDKTLEEEEVAKHKLDRKIAREEDWVRYGVTARRKRNVRRMADLQALRQQKTDARRATGSVVFTAQETTQSGKTVIVADAISKTFGERVIVRDFSIRINRGDRIGLVGPNGAGKTTMINLLTGTLAPDQGSVAIGVTADLVTLDQRRAAFKPETRVADAITDGRGDWITIGGHKKHAASYLKDFLFSPEQFRAPVSSLSGGELGRLALAAALAKPSNLLVLDEPTNDLDIETLDLLEEFLTDYDGTLIIVSHDRNFLDRLATSVIAPSGMARDMPSGQSGQWTEYVGGYTDMIAQRAAGSGTMASSSSSAKAAPKSPPAQTSPTQQKSADRSANRGKLSFKEKYALENLPREMEKMTSQIDALKTALADPKLFATNGALFNQKAAELDKLQSSLAKAEETWIELEMKREELEG